MIVSPERAGDSSKSPAHDNVRHILPLVLLALAVLTYALYFSYLTVTRYAAFESRALDMGNLVQAIWNTSQGNWFHLTNQPGIINRLSLHVEPIILPIAALYRLNSRPEMLLVLQAAVVALGALPAYALAQMKLKNAWIALVFAVAFLLHPSMQAANWLEFHPVTLAPTFLLAAFYCLFAGRTGWYALFAVLAASCKEDIPLLVAMIGLYAWLALGKRRLGFVTMALALTWALVAVFVVQDAFGGGNIHWGRYAYLGESPSEMVRSLLTRPDVVFTQLRQAGALPYIALMALPVALTSFLAPEIYFLALPSLGVNLLADFAPMHRIDGLMYASPIVAFVIVSGIMGVARLGRWLQRATWFASSRTAQRSWLSVVGAAILCGSFAAQWQFGYLPGGGNHQRFIVNEHHRTAANLIAQIPPGARLSVQDKLNPHVANRETLYIFPRIDDADTVFIDVTGPAWPQHPSDVRTTVEDLLDNGFGVAAAEDGYLLLSRDVEARRIPDAFYDSWRVEDASAEVTATGMTTTGMTTTVSFDGVVELVDFDVVEDQHGELVTELVWRALKPLPEDLRFYVAYLDANGDPLADTLFYPPVASLWYPTSKWEPGRRVLVKTLPRTLAHDRFTLAVGLYRGQEGWQNGDRLGAAANSPSVMLLAGETLARLGGYERTRRGWQQLEAIDRPPELPISTEFGELIRLRGATIGERELSSGESVSFALHWQALDDVPFDYSIFAHLLDSAGNKVAQLDWQPSDELGPRPMSTWRPDERIEDRQSLALPDGLPAGEYRLVIGVYDWRDGTRLPANGDAATAGDIVTITRISVR